MLQTKLGAVADDDPTALAYLRPETAQGIFINYLNVQTTMRRKLPFGIAQVGKSSQRSNSGELHLKDA